MTSGISVIARRRRTLLLSVSLLAGSAPAAMAQVTCFGTANIVCTNTGVAGVIGDPPSGPVSGSTSLTIRNEGAAAGIIAITGESGDSSVYNTGVVSDVITAIAGIFSVNALLGDAYGNNSGFVGAGILAKTDYAGNATIRNSGVTRSLRASNNGSVFGRVVIVNSGTASNIVANDTSLLGGSFIENSGQAGFIRALSFSNMAEVSNSGVARDLTAEGYTGVAATNSGVTDTTIASTTFGLAKVVNSGRVAKRLEASSETGQVSIINSGSVGGGLVARANVGGSSIDIRAGGSVEKLGEGANGIEISGRSSVTLSGAVSGGAGGLAIRFDQDRATDDRLEIRQGFTLAGSVDAGGGRDMLAFGGGANPWSFGEIKINGEDNVGDIEVAGGFSVKTPPSTAGLAVTSTFLNFEEISGTSAARGLIRLRGEPVDFHATMRNADVQVELGARVGGTGTMRNLTVQSFGTLDPGAANAVGTLAAAGTARFEEASRYAVDIAAAGRSDLLKAGRVEIDGGYVVGFFASPLHAVANGRSVIIATEAGVEGRFEDVVSPLAFFDFALDYTPTEVGLTTHVKALETAAVTDNQRAVARGLQGFATSADPEALAFYDQLLGAQDFAQVRPIFDAVSGEAHASLQSGLAQSSLTFARSARDRAAANAEAGAPPAAPLAYAGEPIVSTAFEGVSKAAPAPTSLAWGAILGERWSSERGGARTEQTLGGVIGGLDLFQAESAFGAVSGGVSFGYANGSLDVGARGSKAKTDSGHAGIYGALDSGPLLVSAAASYGFHGADTERRIAFLRTTAKADYDAHSLGFSGEARYRFAFGALTLAPLVTLDAAHVMTRAGRERGAGALNLTAKRDDYTAGAAGAGGAISAAWAAGTLGIVRADARAVYEHGLGGDPKRRVSFADGPAFSVTGASADHDRLAVGLGLSVEHANGLTVGARYDGGFAKDLRSHNGQIAASYRF